MRGKVSWDRSAIDKGELALAGDMVDYRTNKEEGEILFQRKGINRK